MKILWVSPKGDGIQLADRLSSAGNQVVLYGEGAGLPLVQQKDLFVFAKMSDLVVVDSSFPVVRTRRSWRPHQDALFWDELRRQYEINAIGPTPTIDLLVGDKRYLRKWCGKLGIPFDQQAEGDPWSSGAWFRENEIVPPGPYMEPWKPLFKSVGFHGWFELFGVIGPDGPVVKAADSTWPIEQIPEGKELDFLQRVA